MSFDQIVQAMIAAGRTLGGWMTALVEAVLPYLASITSDHLEGAGVASAVLLGPTLIAGIARGFVDGLKIEWRRHREKPLVIDGDTISIRGQRIRLYGIDAPEMGQPWWDAAGKEHDGGIIARDALTALVGGGRIEVQILHEDQYQRAVAVLKVNGQDVARALVAGGKAFASPGSSRYRRTEAAAKRRRKGFWQGQLDMPWTWRRVA